jgi:hypothetical protein
MRLHELEDGETIVTKEYFHRELAELELRIADRIIQSERATRAAIQGLYHLVLGTYAMIVLALLVNHYWK